MAKKKQATQPPRAEGANRSLAPMDVYDRVTWWCLHLLVVLVPIGMSNLGPLNTNGLPFTFDQFDIVKVALQRGLILVAAGAWLVGLLMRGGKVRFTRVEWLILAFLGWVVLTTVLSINPMTALFGKYRRFEGLISFITYGVAFFVALQLVDRPSRLRSLARSLAIGGFLVAAYGVIQVIGSVGVGMAQTLRPLSLIVGIGVALACGGLALTSARNDRQTLIALAIGGTIALLGGIVLWAGLAQNLSYSLQQGLAEVSLDPVRWGNLPFEPHRAFSTFGNPDLLGGYLIFPFAVTLGLALSEQHRLWRGIYWVLTLFNVFVGITSYVRGAWIGASVALIAIVIAYLRARAGSDMRLTATDWTFLGAIGFAALAVVGISLTTADSVRNVGARLLSIFKFGEGSALTRFQIWEAAIAAIKERPIFGWGADTFRLLFPMFKPAEYVQVAGYLSVADNVHNYPLQLAAGIGVPGMLGLYALIGWSLVSSAHQAFAKGKAAERLLLAGFWAAALGYAVHLLFGLSVTGSTIFLWLSMGVLLSPSASTKEIRSASWGLIGAGVLVVLVIVGSIFNVRYLVADNHFLKGRITTQGIASVTEIERALALNPYNDQYMLELGAAWHDVFRDSARVFLQQEQAGTATQAAFDQAIADLNRAENAYARVLEFVPEEYDTYVFFASLYNEAAVWLDARYAEDAVRVGLAGVAVEEFGPAVRVQLAIAYMNSDDLDEAIKHLEVATSLDGNYDQAWVLLGQAYHQAGRLKDALAAYEHVLERSPGSSEAATGLSAVEASIAAGGSNQ